MNNVSSSNINQLPEAYNHDAEESPCSLSGIKPRSDSKVGKQLLSVYNSEYGKWLRSFGLKPCWKVHRDCLEFHIWHGYRPNPSTFSYCLKSAFLPSNETLNVWTHFIPLILMIWRTCNIYKSLKDPTHVTVLPFWVQSCGICAVFFASTIAHLFNCYSAIVQEFCYCLDYGVIPLYGLTAAIAFDHYVAPYRCFAPAIYFSPLSYIQFMSMACLIGSYVTCQSRFPHRAMIKYLYRFSPYAACFIIGGVPSCTRYILTLYPQLPQKIGVEFSNSKLCYLGNNNYAFLYGSHLIAMTIGILFVGSRFPERWYPGTFDIIGHSHQSFHIFIAIGLYLQHRVTENAMREVIWLQENEVPESSFEVNAWTILGVVLFFVIAVSLVIYRTSTIVGRLVEMQRRKHSE